MDIYTGGENPFIARNPIGQEALTDVMEFVMEGFSYAFIGFVFRMASIMFFKTLGRQYGYGLKREDAEVKPSPEIEKCIAEHKEALEDEKLTITEIAKKFDVDTNVLTLARRTLRIQQSVNDDLEKFGESFAKFITFGYAWYLGTSIALNSVYWNDYEVAWATRQVNLPSVERYYYLVEWSWYGQKMIVDPFFYNRKDYMTMVAHHAVTSALILLSINFNLWAWGVMIFVIHDPSDCLLGLSKCFYYFGFGVMKDVAFALFALSWYITRNTLYWYFPVCMAYQNYYVHNKAFCDGHHAGECYGGGLLLILLAGLGLLQFVWSKQIWGLVMKKIRGRIVTDIRSGPESDKKE